MVGRGFFALAWVAAVIANSAEARVDVHPAPPGLPVNHRFSVHVSEDGESWTAVTVLDAIVGADEKRHIGFVGFDADFQSPVKVRVSFAGEAPEAVVIRPRSRDIQSFLNDGRLHFEISEPGALSVEPDGNIWSNLLVFVNPIEADPPALDATGVIYFAPGEHLLGGDGRGQVSIDSGETVYLAPGSVVYGRIDTGGKRDITIRGRGVLCGSRFDHDRDSDRPQMIYIGNTRGLRIEGITLLDAPSWNIHLHQVNDAVVRDVKVIAWQRETDGINPRGCQNLLVDRCFVRSADDSISVKLGNAHDPASVTQRNRDIRIRRSVLWPDRAHAVVIGPEGASGNANDHITESVRVSDVDVLRHAEENPDFYGALAVMAADDQIIRDVIFEDVRMSGLERGNPIDVRFVDNQYTQGFGKRIEKVTFRRISVREPTKTPIRIAGHDTQRRIVGIVLKDVTIDAEPLRGLEDKRLDVGRFVDDIDVSVTDERGDAS